LQTTLRQEGLLSAYKAARESPVNENPADGAPKRVHFLQSPPKYDKSETRKTSEEDKLLQDLTNLSEMVLANSDVDE